MKDSIFSRVFSYRQHENHSPLENYLTEIFAYCLEFDMKFRVDFVTKLLEIADVEREITISTQEVYHGYGRPDIQITYGKTIILIECKVESSERENQLNDYALILNQVKQDYLDRRIVFLTKYFEVKELASEDVNLHLVRWFQIHDLIDDYNSQVTLQFRRQ